MAAPCSHAHLGSRAGEPVNSIPTAGSTTASGYTTTSFVLATDPSITANPSPALQAATNGQCNFLETLFEEGAPRTAQAARRRSATGRP